MVRRLLDLASALALLVGLGAFAFTLETTLARAGGLAEVALVQDRDGDVRVGVERAVLGLEGEITVEVHQGGVTLRGTVPSQSVKDRAGERAQAVPGVTSVTNELFVDDLEADEQGEGDDPGREPAGRGDDGSGDDEAHDEASADDGAGGGEREGEAGAPPEDGGGDEGGGQP